MQNVALRYRASEHGWAADDFHRMCDKVPRLLVIARSTRGYVFGGFTSVGFGGGYLQADAAAFLFTLINPHGITPTMLASKSDGENVLRTSPSYGPMFGKSCAMWFVSNCNTAKDSVSFPDVSYTDTTGKGGHLFTGSNILGTMTEILAFSV
jgi:hypothetical protein